MVNLDKSSLFSICKSWSIEIILINIKSSKLLVTSTNKYRMVFALQHKQIRSFLGNLCFEYPPV